LEIGQKKNKSERKKKYLLRAFIHKGNRELANQRFYIHVPIRIFSNGREEKKAT
jgi:hypothetical protein